MSILEASWSAIFGQLICFLCSSEDDRQCARRGLCHSYRRVRVKAGWVLDTATLGVALWDTTSASLIGIGLEVAFSPAAYVLSERGDREGAKCLAARALL